jgi:hypothetical protein
MKVKRFVLSFFMVLFFASLVSAASDAPWKEYKLRHGGTLYLPADWRVSFPPAGIKPDTSEFWIEFRAGSPGGIDISSELTVLWFRGCTRVPRSPGDWRMLMRVVTEGQYKTQLKRGSFSQISEVPFEMGRMRGVVATYAIRPSSGVSSLQVKYVLVLYQDEIFLLRMHYPPVSEKAANDIAREILRRWEMPPPSASFPWPWIGIGGAAVLFAAILWRRKKIAG